MKFRFTLLLLFVAFAASAKKPNSYVRISTAYGDCIIRLYNETPQHRDNFIKLTKKGFYNGTLFHRVIQNFMIQGGDPDSKDTAKNKPGAALGEGDVKYTVPAEFRDSLFHKRGVLAAARDNNPAKASSGCQFYIVEGKRFTDEDLDKLIQTRLNGRQIPASQRAIYKSVGGVPHLDQNYTVYGEVVTGIDMVDRIAAVKKDAKDRPLANVVMTVSLLKRGDCRRLDKLLALQK
jgi:cyclophilin family peptidyl-prolyl cis-trans isomerase